jgi:hypothetical protein
VVEQVVPVARSQWHRRAAVHTTRANSL